MSARPRHPRSWATNRLPQRVSIRAGGGVGTVEPAIPAGLTNRAADIWEPLLTLADLAERTVKEGAEGGAGEARNEEADTIGTN